MPTYRTTARNQFRSPSGAVGEAPDGPGAMATLLDDVDNYLGVGGAEYVSTVAGLAAIPSSRRFEGKLAYAADTKTTYRYVGIGNTALLGNDTTHPWQAWHRPSAVYGPSIGGVTLGASTVTALSQIVAGRLFLDVYVVAGTGFSHTAGQELQMSLGPGNVVVGQFALGTGFYYPSNNTGGGSQIPLQAFVAGSNAGVLATLIRLRVPRVNTATSPQNVVLQSVVNAIGVGTATDQFGWSVSAPSALVA